MKRRDFLGYSSFALAATATPGFSQASVLFDDPVRIGIIGTGQRGTGHASVMQKIPAIRLVAGCDIIGSHLNGCMDPYGAKGSRKYMDYRKLLDDRNVEAVLISSPLYLHEKMVLDAIDAGKHIYCEKTMAYDIEQTLSVARKVKGNPGKIFQVGYQYRDFPLYHEAKKVIDNGWLGEIRYFDVYYNRNNDWRRPVPDPSLERQINWRMYREYSGGLMAELSSHQMDIVNWFVNDTPSRIMGIGGISHWKDGRETYDHINLAASYARGVAGQITSHIANAHMGYTVKIMGTDGTVEINFAEAFFYREANASNKSWGIVDGVSGATLKMEPGKPVKIPVEIREGYSATTYALEAFARSVREGIQPRSNIHTGTLGSLVVAMGNKAMQSGSAEEWKSSYNI